MNCPYCGSYKLKKEWLNKGRQQYKCQECGREHTEGAKLRSKPKPKIIRDCEYCGKQTDNPKFCSISCAATYNNIHYPKRTKNKKTYYCKYCGIEVKARRVSCSRCKPNSSKWDNVPLAAITDKASYQIAAVVRQRARYHYRSSARPKYCVNCGYDKHYEVCHIHAIMDFSPETNMAEINKLENLVALCPNCHWELDRGLLSIDEIRAKNNAIS